MSIKLLKIIAIISFLIIPGLQENAIPNFALLLIFLFQFFSDIINQELSIFWEGFISIPIIGTLITFYLCEKRRDVYLQIFCFIALLMSILILSEIAYPSNFHRISYEFIVPLVVFIITSILLIVKSFFGTIKKIRH